MSDDPKHFVFSPPDSRAAAVEFRYLNAPRRREVTGFEVVVAGAGIDARVPVASLSADWGVRQLPPGDDGVTRYEDVRLSTSLRELGDSPMPWEGIKASWRSLEDQLAVEAACDGLGHVTFVLTIRPRAYEPPWWCSTTFMHPIGDLLDLANRLETWFTE